MARRPAPLRGALTCGGCAGAAGRSAAPPPARTEGGDGGREGGTGRDALPTGSLRPGSARLRRAGAQVRPAPPRRTPLMPRQRPPAREGGSRAVRRDPRHPRSPPGCPLLTAERGRCRRLPGKRAVAFAAQAAWQWCADVSGATELLLQKCSDLLTMSARAVLEPQLQGESICRFTKPVWLEKSRVAQRILFQA